MNELVWVRPAARASRGGQPAAATWSCASSAPRSSSGTAPRSRPRRASSGANKASGAPLDGTRETDIPDFARRPEGPHDPARRRTSGSPTPAPRRPRRTASCGAASTTRAGFAANGQLDQGLLFVCFQQDLDRGFVAVQSRLNGEALEEYIRPVGGGFFFALPGVRDGGDWLGSGLLS